MEDPLLELKQCVVKRKWVRNSLRTNLGGETYHKNGWLNLRQGVYSNTERGGRILELCQEMLGSHITDVCCNRGVHCGPHRDRANTSESCFLMFHAPGKPDFEGGAYIGAGVGMRYYTDFGPVRLDFAVPLNKKDRLDQNYQIYISIGQSF